MKLETLVPSSLNFEITYKLNKPTTSVENAKNKSAYGEGRKK